MVTAMSLLFADSQRQVLHHVTKFYISPYIYESGETRIEILVMNSLQGVDLIDTKEIMVGNNKSCS